MSFCNLSTVTFFNLHYCLLVHSIISLNSKEHQTIETIRLCKNKLTTENIFAENKLILPPFGEISI